MGLGSRIGEECKRQGLTLRQLAIKANVPYSTLYSAVKRDSDGISSETIERLTAAMNVSVSYLMGFEDPDFIDYYKDLAEPLEEEHLLHLYRQLNVVGQDKAVERVEELTMIPKYRCQRPTDGPQDAPGVPGDKEPAEK